MDGQMCVFFFRFGYTEHIDAYLEPFRDAIVSRGRVALPPFIKLVQSPVEAHFITLLRHLIRP
jgi:hypothetical protein